MTRDTSLLLTAISELEKAVSALTDAKYASGRVPNERAYTRAHLNKAYGELRAAGEVMRKHLKELNKE